jgi:hypothetical protein
MLFELSAALGGTVSLKKEPAWSTMRGCARGCLQGGYIDGLAGYGMGCPEPRPNDCFCRTDLYSVATSFVSSCLTKECTIGNLSPDYTSAMRLCDSYCQANGYTASGALNVGVITATGDSAPTLTRVTIVAQTVISGSRTLTRGKWMGRSVCWVELWKSILVVLWRVGQVGYAQRVASPKRLLALRNDSTDKTPLI